MKVAVLISNMGGPESLDAVEPFLFQIFNDPHIIDIPLPKALRRVLATLIARRRVGESMEIYRKLGGKTPLHRVMHQQAQALQSVLNRQDGLSFVVRPANRYGHPSLEDVLPQIHKDAIDRMVVLSMYPFFATSTSGSIGSELNRLRKKFSVPAEKLRFIDRYGQRPDFISAMAEHICEQIGKDECLNGQDVHILLSAHSIPKRHLKKGDPYWNEVRQAVKLLKEKLPNRIRLHLSFQSKIGPVKWLTPSTEDTIIQLAKSGLQKLYVYPLGFVADNSETVYEIGMLYRELALKQGIKQFVRLEALNAYPAFIEVLQKVVLEQLTKKEYN